MEKYDYFNARATLDTGSGEAIYYRIHALADEADVDRLPVSIRIMLEQALRQVDDFEVTRDDVLAIARWDGSATDKEIPFKPARVILQDFTGVPSVVDLAALRSAMAALGGDPERINPLVPVDLVIDHSVQVDQFGSKMALFYNAEREFERNRERYEFLRWGQKSFDNFTVVPPATGIVHQVNLEFLARVVQRRERAGESLIFPDTLVGTDSHTTMINGLGVVGWGVGGIEAEAVMLGQPIYMLLPQVTGFKLTGSLPEGATATDLVLRVTQMLREHGVVGRFVEFYGPGLSKLSLADRATIANMSPEYGATIGFFPVDDETLRYLRSTGRSEELVTLVERYNKEQGLFRTDESVDPIFTDTLHLDLGDVEVSLAGPKRPQDRISLTTMKQSFERALEAPMGNHGFGLSDEETERRAVIEGMNGSIDVTHGMVAIAAITSCTNTSNPSVMVGAGLLARNAVERGLTVPPYVKTSLAPGSRVVTEYLQKSGLMPYLEQLGFHVVGYGCTTCIAEGTPVLMADGTARRIETLPASGGAQLFGPTARGRLALATQREMMVQGTRDCVTLTFQDGRTLICTPDHEILCADGSWKRADALDPARDRVIFGLDAPLDEPGADEDGYTLQAGTLRLSMETTEARQRTLAFARLLGHLLNDGSISELGQGRMHVGQAVDREVLLADIERVTGKRPAATRYDDRKWTVVLPMELTAAILTLSGVEAGRRIHQEPTLPAFVLDERCPVALVREFLGGLFGADGHAPVLHRQSDREEDAVLIPPAFSRSALPEHVDAMRAMMNDLRRLLARCGVQVDGARTYDFPVRRAASSYPAAQDGRPRIEVRLTLPDGLSFVERVGYRYSVDKAMRASAAAVYWRTVGGIHEQRQWMAERLTEVHQADSTLSFARARREVAAELEAEEPAIFPHYSLLEGHDRFSRLPEPDARPFRPLHRDACGFPSPVELFREMGVRHWFAPLLPRDESDGVRSYCTDKEALTLPTFSLALLDRREAGPRAVYDLAVDETQAFIAGSVAVHNCIGNSGPLPEPVVEAINEGELVAASVLSGNRNFEGRISPHIKANFLASPPLVVAYALAGSVDKDLTREPLGVDKDGNEVYLRDIWPSPTEIAETIRTSINPQMFAEQYGNVYDGNEEWNQIEIPEGALYAWDDASTYIQHPPFFQDLSPDPESMTNIEDARVLMLMGDSVTTDHISPAGSIAVKSPAGQYLINHGVEPRDFNSYGSRRGNHEVMMRGTFANIRIKNHLLPGTEGPQSVHLPSGEVGSVYDVAMRYVKSGTPLIVLAGKEYGTGSSRDWAAKGTYLLGVKAVIAESFERIHRSNLIGMGVLPLQFQEGQSWQSLGLTGQETFDIMGIDDEMAPGQTLDVLATREDGSTVSFKVVSRLDTPVEVNYYRNGGILHTVLRNMAREAREDDSGNIDLDMADPHVDA